LIFFDTDPKRLDLQSAQPFGLLPNLDEVRIPDINAFYVCTGNRTNDFGAKTAHERL
jgi:hypothetical protein